MLSLTQRQKDKHTTSIIGKHLKHVKTTAYLLGFARSPEPARGHKIHHAFQYTAWGNSEAARHISCNQWLATSGKCNTTVSAQNTCKLLVHTQNFYA